jgi:glycosyltransferase involved in cell wall biosynthesis
VISSYWPRPDQPHVAFFEVDQVRALAELGHQVHVLIQAAPWQQKRRFLDQKDLGLDPMQVGLEQIMMPRLPEPLSRSARGAVVNQRAAGWRMRAWLAGREAKSGSADAVIVHGERNIGLSAGLWNPGGRLRSVMILHGADPVLEALPASAAQRHLGKSVNAGFDRIILVGNRLRPYAQRLGYETSRTKVIPNGFQHPPPPADPLAEPMGPVRLSVAARLVEVKGIDDTLLALADVSKAKPDLDWRFDIIGDGPERSALEALSARLELQERVQFHGTLPHQKVLSHLEKSAIFVMPSWNEAFGLAYLEAMALGNAVVGCHGNGAADILIDGVDGCLVPPRNVPALAATLEKLIADPDQRRALARAALDSVCRFSWPENARALLEEL